MLMCDSAAILDQGERQVACSEGEEREIACATKSESRW